MIQLMLYSFIMLNSITFFYTTHPLAMGLTLLIQTLLMCLITGLMTKSFWFSYILFLIFLGGMLILFIYVTSLASNEMFTLSIKMIIMNIIILSIMLLIMIMIDKNLIMNWMPNNEMMSIFNKYSYFSENALNLNKLYNYPTNIINIMLMNYLLITLIAIVKITKLSKGPLRLMM